MLPGVLCQAQPDFQSRNLWGHHAQPQVPFFGPGVAMAGLKLRISLWSFGKNTQYLLALSFLMVAQLVAGCTGVVVPRSQATPQGTLSITSSSLPSGKAQTAYTARLTATGGTAPYT